MIRALRDNVIAKELTDKEGAIEVVRFNKMEVGDITKAKVVSVGNKIGVVSVGEVILFKRTDAGTLVDGSDTYFKVAEKFILGVVYE